MLKQNRTAALLFAMARLFIAKFRQSHPLTVETLRQGLGLPAVLRLRRVGW